MPDYRKQFFDDPKAFFERYSINLPGNPEEAGKIGQLELMQGTFNKIEGAKDHLAGSSVSKSFHKFKRAKSSVHVSALAHNAAWQVDELQKKATLVVRTAAKSVTRTEAESASLQWFLCLMLPWIQNGVTTMQLRKDSRADAFFTGQMNGCSFVVTGDPREPYVSHINCDDSSEYEDKYRQVLKDSGVKTKNALRLGREDYKLDAGGIAREEATVQQDLSDQNRKLQGGIITDTLCFVMGRRVEGKWEFFYQRVISQSYQYKNRLGRAGGLIKFLGRDNRQPNNVTVYRAITPYTRLWPEGLGRLTS